MADQEFVGSHEKSNAGYGTNGDKSASSVLPGKPQPEMYNKAVKVPNVVIPANNQTRPVSAHQAVPNAHGQKNRNDNATQILGALNRKRK
jgi:hypothetical protein